MAPAAGVAAEAAAALGTNGAMANGVMAGTTPVATATMAASVAAVVAVAAMLASSPAAAQAATPAMAVAAVATAVAAGIAVGTSAIVSGSPITACLAVVAASFCVRRIMAWWTRSLEDPDAGGVLKGFHRYSLFVRKIFPILLHYRMLRMKVMRRRAALEKSGLSVDDEEDPYAELHEIYAPRILQAFRQLKGFYIKVGQYAASLGRVSLPHIYVETLKVLLEDCPSVPFHVIQRAVEKEFRRPLSAVFESFDEEPMHTASIGQVHAAVLHGGRHVVVKVQIPGCEAEFRADVSCVLWCLNWLFSSMIPVVYMEWLKGTEKLLDSEFDYRQEARLQREAGGYLEDLEGVCVPLPLDAQHPDAIELLKGGLCTRRILTMERIKGNSVARWGHEVQEKMAQAFGITREELIEKWTENPDALEELKPDDLTLTAITIGNLWRDTTYNVGVMLYNATLSDIEGPAEYVRTPMPQDTEEFANLLMKGQAHLIFNHGFVNTDPHPGNIMVLPDATLAFLDWGQVGRVSVEQRFLLANVIIAVADKDEVFQAECMRAMGVRTKLGFDFSYSRRARLYFDAWSDEFCEELGGIVHADDNLNRVDWVEEDVGEHLIMVVRNILMTRESMTIFGFAKVNPAEHLRPFAKAYLEKYGRPIPETKCRYIPPPREFTEFLEQKESGNKM